MSRGTRSRVRGARVSRQIATPFASERAVGSPPSTGLRGQVARGGWHGLGPSDISGPEKEALAAVGNHLNFSVYTLRQRLHAVFAYPEGQAI